MPRENEISFNSVTAGGFWVILEKVVKQGLSLVRTVILARLLGPEEFGVLGVSLLLVDIVHTFSQPGVGFALIYKQTEEKCHLDSAWVLSIIRAILIGLILVVLAPLASNFFAEPRANAIIRIIALAKVIEGFVNVGLVLIRRSLRFKKVFLYESSVGFLSLVSTVLLALWLRNAMALATGLLVTSVIRVGLSYLVATYRPSFRFSWQSIRELLDYGRWITVSSIMQFILNEGDDLIAGRLFGSEVLGIYQMAYRLSNLPATQITYAVNQLAFPTYAALQDEELRLFRSYLRLLQITAIFVFPLCAGIGFLARPLVLTMLGADWVPAIGLVRLLSIWGVTRAIWATTGPLYRAVGAPSLNSKLLGIRVLIQLSLLWPFANLWGVSGIGLAVVVSALLIFPISLYHVKNILKTDWQDIGETLLAPVSGTVVMGIAVLFAEGICFSSALMELLGKGLIAFISFAMGFVAADSLLNWESFRLLHRLKQRFTSSLLDSRVTNTTA